MNTPNIITSECDVAPSSPDLVAAECDVAPSGPALSEANCDGFFNEEQEYTASCANGAPNEPVTKTVAAGTIRSPISVAAANAIALAQATAEAIEELGACLFYNEEQRVVNECADSFTIGVVAAGEVSSDVSQEAANEEALNQATALAQAECAFPVLGIPEVDFDYEISGRTVSFFGGGGPDDFTTIPPQPPVDTWNWDVNWPNSPRFHDTTKNIVHTYDSPGIYDVLFWHTNILDGSTGFSSGAGIKKSVIITNQVPVISGFDVGNVSGLEYSFDSGGFVEDPDGDEIASYAWDFGDGSTGSGESVLHTFLAPGIYVVTLTVTDVFGGVSQPFVKVVNISNFTITPAITSGAISYFSPNNLPEGSYRIEYVNGALKYGVASQWALNLSTGTSYRISYDNGASLLLGPMLDYNTYATQPDLEAHQAGSYVDFYHIGGKVGMYLQDSPYGDNVAGSPNPTFKLICLSVT